MGAGRAGREAVGALRTKWRAIASLMTMRQRGAATTSAYPCIESISSVVRSYMRVATNQWRIRLTPYLGGRATPALGSGVRAAS